MTDHARPCRAADGVGVHPEFLRLLRGEITASEWGAWAERQYGYDTQEAFDAAKALSRHARWWFVHGAIVGATLGATVAAALEVIHG